MKNKSFFVFVFFFYKIISNISTLYFFFWITFFSFSYFLFFFFCWFFFPLRFNFFFFLNLLLKSAYQFLIVRVTHSTLAGGRLPSVKIRVPLPFPLRATWSSCYYRFGSKGIHCTWFFFRTTRQNGSHFTHISTILLSLMSIKNDRLET